jgi:hypothetical protein
MGTPTALLGHAQEDAGIAKQLEAAFARLGLSAHPQQDVIRTSGQAPEIAGQAVASTDLYILLWSAASARSKPVEFEWTTALALNKTILLCLLDDTLLPAPAFYPFHGLPDHSTAPQFSRKPILHLITIPPPPAPSSPLSLRTLRRTQAEEFSSEEAVVYTPGGLASDQGSAGSGHPGKDECYHSRDLPCQNFSGRLRNFCTCALAVHTTELTKPASELIGPVGCAEAPGEERRKDRSVIGLTRCDEFRSCVLWRVLDATRHLAAPLDMDEILRKTIASSLQVLDA